MDSHEVSMLVPCFHYALTMGSLCYHHALIPAAEQQGAAALLAGHCQVPAVPGWGNLEYRDNEITLFALAGVPNQ